MKHPEVDSLMAKGCVLMGQSVVGQVWPGDTQASIKPLPFFLVKITTRGLNKLKEYEESSLKCGNSV